MNIGAKIVKQRVGESFEIDDVLSVFVTAGENCAKKRKPVENANSELGFGLKIIKKLDVPMALLGDEISANKYSIIMAENVFVADLKSKSFFPLITLKEAEISTGKNCNLAAVLSILGLFDRDFQKATKLSVTTAIVLKDILDTVRIKKVLRRLILRPRRETWLKALH